MQTLKGWFGPERPFPVLQGNDVFIEEIKPSPPAGMETHTSLRVVNILAENLTEILKRLGTDTIEMAIYPGTNLVSTLRHRNQPERKVTHQTAYAVITDTRIPRGWFLSRPKLGNFPSVKADEILAAFPLSFKPEPMMVPVTHRMQTLAGFPGHAQMQFPLPVGNSVTITQRKSAPPGGLETHSQLLVVNIVAENLTEILKRIGTETIEMAVYPGTNFVSTFQERDQPEREVICQTGYAVITDTRIPRDWFLFYPSLGNFPPAKAEEILDTFPLSFRPNPEIVNRAPPQ